MISTGAGFALISQLCFICLLASLFKPHWFRFNGKTPSRMKIGSLWTLALLLSTFGAALPGRGPSSESMTDVVPTEAATDAATLAVPDTLDIASPTNDQADIVVDQAEQAAKEAMQIDASQIPIVPGPVYSERRPGR